MSARIFTSFRFIQGAEAVKFSTPQCLDTFAVMVRLSPEIPLDFYKSSIYRKFVGQAQYYLHKTRYQEGSSREQVDDHLMAGTEAYAESEEEEF